ncbi:uncharacterized protein [Macrobrachium rosenbergii]|uniref:uncharacterized protein isoform X2 n=1 Tax=Macrobrachium rosenbergii TaxID=79674 RepID=UPI0034D4BA84
MTWHSHKEMDGSKTTDVDVWGKQKASPYNNWKDGRCVTDIRTIMMFYSVTQEDVRTIDLSVYLLKVDSSSYCCSKRLRNRSKLENSGIARGTFQEVPPGSVNECDLGVTNGTNLSKTTVPDRFAKKQLGFPNGYLQCSWSYNYYLASLQCPQTIRNRVPCHPATYTSCRRSPATETEHSSSIFCTSPQCSKNNVQKRTSPAANTLSRCCLSNEPRHNYYTSKSTQCSSVGHTHSTVSYEMSRCSTVSEQGYHFSSAPYTSSQCSQIRKRLSRSSPVSYKSQRFLANEKQQVSSASPQRSRSQRQTSQAAYTTSVSSPPQDVLPESPTYRVLQSSPTSSYGLSSPPNSKTHFGCSLISDQLVQHSQTGGKFLAGPYTPVQNFQTSRKQYAPTPISHEPSHQFQYVRRLCGASDCLQIIVNAS